MNYSFELTDSKEQPVLSVRTRTAVANLQAEMGEAYGAIYPYLGEKGAQPAGAPYAAYYNMDMQDLDVEIGIPVAVPLTGRGIVKAGVIPAGKQASCVYKGSYAEIGPAYEALTKWIADNGHVPTGVCYEFYLNEPGAVPDSELLTKIVYLLH
jgi:effector-binding domain-containing protein